MISDHTKAAVRKSAAAAGHFDISLGGLDVPLPVVPPGAEGAEQTGSIAVAATAEPMEHEKIEPIEREKIQPLVEPLGMTRGREDIGAVRDGAKLDDLMPLDGSAPAAPEPPAPPPAVTVDAASSSSSTSASNNNSSSTAPNATNAAGNNVSESTNILTATGDSASTMSHAAHGGGKHHHLAPKRQQIQQHVVGQPGIMMPPPLMGGMTGLMATIHLNPTSVPPPVTVQTPTGAIPSWSAPVLDDLKVDASQLPEPVRRALRRMDGICLQAVRERNQMSEAVRHLVSEVGRLRECVGVKMDLEEIGRMMQGGAGEVSFARTRRDASEASNIELLLEEKRLRPLRKA
ncbi:hypothetical protein HK101_006536 [Irineochytrium annulatum]|nr:hypothetical protein HK101_006536 [Irineochytrium annulatum]